MDEAAAFTGEIQQFGGNFAPQGWLFCNGQLLPISDYQALFSLIGTTYGGDGQSTFALPNLQARIPIGDGQGPGLTNRPLGSAGGVSQVSLQRNECAIHNHGLRGSTQGYQASNVGILASSLLYHANDGATLTPLAGETVEDLGGSQPHDNEQPYLTINFIICVIGNYPS